MDRKYDMKKGRAYPGDKPQRTGAETPASHVICGRNPVRELLKSGRDIDKIFVQRGEREGSAVALVGEAKSRKIPVVEVEKQKLDKLSCGSPHQGIVAFAAETSYVSLQDLLAIAESRGEKPFLAIADGIEDPHNLGALLRCCDGAGVHGLILPKRRSVGVTETVAKASAGASEHVAIARVSNIASAIDELKKAGVWIFACEAGGTHYCDADFDCGAAIVFGSEGDGVSRLVLEKCDFTVSIPMYGKVNSFNVSTAAAVVLCEAARQRHGGK